MGVRAGSGVESESISQVTYSNSVDPNVDKLYINRKVWMKRRRNNNRKVRRDN